MLFELLLKTEMGDRKNMNIKEKKKLYTVLAVILIVVGLLVVVLGFVFNEGKLDLTTMCGLLMCIGGAVLRYTAVYRLDSGAQNISMHSQVNSYGIKWCKHCSDYTEGSLFCGRCGNKYESEGDGISGTDAGTDNVGTASASKGRTFIKYAVIIVVAWFIVYSVLMYFAKGLLHKNKDVPVPDFSDKNAGIVIVDDDYPTGAYFDMDYIEFANTYYEMACTQYDNKTRSKYSHWDQWELSSSDFKEYSDKDGYGMEVYVAKNKSTAPYHAMSIHVNDNNIVYINYAEELEATHMGVKVEIDYYKSWYRLKSVLAALEMQEVYNTVTEDMVEDDNGTGGLLILPTYVEKYNVAVVCGLDEYGCFSFQVIAMSKDKFDEIFSEEEYRRYK